MKLILKSSRIKDDDYRLLEDTCDRRFAESVFLLMSYVDYPIETVRNALSKTKYLFVIPDRVKDMLVSKYPALRSEILNVR